MYMSMIIYFVDVSNRVGYAANLWPTNTNKGLFNYIGLIIINNIAYDRFMYFISLCRSAQLLIKI